LKAEDTTSVRNKNPKKAFIFSLVPGMGQAYNGRWIKSALVIGLEISSFLSWKENLYRYNQYDNNNFPLRKYRYLEKRNKYAWWMGIIYIYSMIDAVVDSHLHSFDDLMDSPIKNIKNNGDKNGK
tara:strand:+ start:1534 stop:1908 length:375 start_codon:yes stop_codon:yes gene_type:complete